jgi:hypothetical protein
MPFQGLSNDIFLMQIQSGRTLTLKQEKISLKCDGKAWIMIPHASFKPPSS